MTHQAIRYHDISVGHRVTNHESKCAHLHGHNYRVWWYCEAQLDDVGRVLDFSVIKAVLCEWLERNWDHRFLIWREDPWADEIAMMDPAGVVKVDFNPTAENMAEYLFALGNRLLAQRGVRVVRVQVDETRKCSASFEE